MRSFFIIFGPLLGILIALAVLLVFLAPVLVSYIRKTNTQRIRNSDYVRELEEYYDQTSPVIAELMVQVDSRATLKHELPSSFVNDLYQISPTIRSKQLQGRKR